jgi:threonine dehydrogenase-like Zn-dependent dehydrogenase
MKALTITPKVAGSVKLRDVPEPTLDQIPNNRGVLVRIVRVGLDGTDHEIYTGEYGAAPEGSDFLIMGHESFGVVEAVGSAVTDFAPGDFVVARVRRAGSSIYDLIDMPDFTTDEEYFEHGISRVHGFLTEKYVEDPRYLIKIPPGLKDVAVLLEPTSIIEKGIAQAYEIQRRLKVWRPQRAAVLGTGSVGLLAIAGLRNRGLEVFGFARHEPPYLNSELIEALGAHYVSTNQKSLADVGKEQGGFDLVFEASGFSPLVFEAMHELLDKNGVLILSSVTGGSREIEIPSDAINLEFVLGNKVMVGTVNANREHFEAGVADMALLEATAPGWLLRLITDRIHGLDDWPTAYEKLGSEGAIKVVVEISPAP